LARRNSSHKAAPQDVGFRGECVAKLFAALRARNNRILQADATNRHCAFSSDVESIFRQLPLKILLQHITADNGSIASLLRSALSEIRAGQRRRLAAKNRDMVAMKMTPAQIAEAQKLARVWKPNTER
jgi:hypothetical protein